MAGPSWLLRQGVKAFALSNGADPETATALGYTASTLSSLVFHDHHTHILPDAPHFGYDYSPSDFTESEDHTYYRSTSDFVSGNNGYRKS